MVGVVVVALVLAGVGLGFRWAASPATVPPGAASPSASPGAIAGQSFGPGPSAAVDSDPVLTALRTAVAQPAFSGHVDLTGTITIANASAGISGSVDFAGSDFRSESRFDHPLATLRQQTAMIVVNGQAHVRADGRSWTLAPEPPPTLAAQLLGELAVTHMLTLAPADSWPASNVVRISWQGGAAILAERLALLGGARVRLTESRVDVLSSRGGEPTRIEAELHGTWTVGGKRSRLTVVLTYHYGEIGAPIRIIAPTLLASPSPG
jgi:hypothetical protein